MVSATHRRRRGAVKEQSSLEFEGAFQDAEVWVNGKRAGEHLGGYTGFSLDITGDLHTGDNVIAVRVNNLWNGQLNLARESMYSAAASIAMCTW